MDADVPEIAQQLLEEARALDSQHPEIQDVTGRLLAASTLAAAGDRRPPHHLMSRGIVVLLAIALALMWAAAAIESADVKAALKHLLITGGSAPTYISQSAQRG